MTTSVKKVFPGYEFHQQFVVATSIETGKTLRGYVEHVMSAVGDPKLTFILNLEGAGVAAINDSRYVLRKMTAKEITIFKLKS